MRVAVKNNSLVEAIKVLGAQRAGLLMANLVSNLPSVIFGESLNEFRISISYNIGQILIGIDVTPAYFVSLYSSDLGIEPSVVPVLESKGIILGLIYLVLNIMPVQESSPFIFKGVREATAAGYLFEWKDVPDLMTSAWSTYYRQTYTGPTSMIDTVKSDMEFNAAMDSIIWKIMPGFIDTLKPPTAISIVDSKSEYEEGTLHRRMMDI